MRQPAHDVPPDGAWPSLIAWGSIAFPASLPAQGIAYEGGLSLSTGSCLFTERTTTCNLSTALAWSLGRVTLRASVWVYAQRTTLVTSGSGRPLPGGQAAGGTDAG